MENEAIKRLFANYIHEGKWSKENVPEPIREDIMKIVSELKEEDSDEGGEE